MENSIMTIQPVSISNEIKNSVNKSMDEKAIAEFVRIVLQLGELKDEELKDKEKSLLDNLWFSIYIKRFELVKIEQNFEEYLRSSFLNLAQGCIRYIDKIKGSVNKEILSANLKEYLSTHKKEILELVYGENKEDDFFNKIYKENEKFWKDFLNKVMDEKAIDKFVDNVVKSLGKSGDKEEKVKYLIPLWFDIHVMKEKFSAKEDKFFEKYEEKDYLMSFKNLALGCISYIDEVKELEPQVNEKILFAQLKEYLQTHKKEILELVYGENKEDDFFNKIYEGNEKFWKPYGIISKNETLKEITNYELINKIINFDNTKAILRELKNQNIVNIDLNKLKQDMYCTMLDESIKKQIKNVEIHAKNTKIFFRKPKPDITYSIIERINANLKDNAFDDLEKNLRLLGVQKKKVEEIIGNQKRLADEGI